jgi:hypothetical protein
MHGEIRLPSTGMDNIEISRMELKLLNFLGVTELAQDRFQWLVHVLLVIIVCILKQCMNIEYL